MLIFGAVTKSYITRMFKSNSGEPYAGKLHVRFLEEFISNCLIIREGENLLMPGVVIIISIVLYIISEIYFPLWILISYIILSLPLAIYSFYKHDIGKGIFYVLDILFFICLYIYTHHLEETNDKIIK